MTQQIWSLYLIWNHCTKRKWVSPKQSAFWDFSYVHSLWCQNSRQVKIEGERQKNVRISGTVISFVTSLTKVDIRKHYVGDSDFAVGWCWILFWGHWRWYIGSPSTKRKNSSQIDRLVLFFFGFKNALPWPVNMLKVGINVHASVTDKLSVKFLFGFF